MATFVLLDEFLICFSLKFKMFLKSFIFFILTFPFFAFSSYVDWSGWMRAEGYYEQKLEEQSYYSNYHLVLKPRLHVIDGLKVFSRWDIGESEGLSLPGNYDNQTGLVLFSSEGVGSYFTKPVLQLSQLYMNYETEFFKVLLGKAPRHFGMGITYSSSDSPFQHWTSVYSQALLYLKYFDFYIQPMAFLYHDFSMALQAGVSRDSWSVEGFYEYIFNKRSFIEAFGKYEQDNWRAKGSFNYVIDNSDLGVALEAEMDFVNPLPCTVALKGGGVFGELAFHPNYDVALLLWNRTLYQAHSDQENSFLQIDELQINKGLYFSPSLSFHFFNKALQVKPLLVLAHSYERKEFYYEFDLESLFHVSQKLFFLFKGGVLYDRDFFFGFLGQAAVSF